MTFLSSIYTISLMDFGLLSHAPPKALARFLAKVARHTKDSCWNWTACKSQRGYGRFGVGRRTYFAHRVAYLWHTGAEDDPALVTDHRCRNTSCVNPLHLRLVTPKENSLSGVSFAANNARKTHCPEGHPLEGDNLVQYDLERGSRSCKTCRYAWIREHKKRNRVYTRGPYKPRG